MSGFFIVLYNLNVGKTLDYINDQIWTFSSNCSKVTTWREKKVLNTVVQPELKTCISSLILANVLWTKYAFIAVFYEQLHKK